MGEEDLIASAKFEKAKMLIALAAESKVLTFWLRALLFIPWFLVKWTAVSNWKLAQTRQAPWALYQLYLHSFSYLCTCLRLIMFFCFEYRVLGINGLWHCHKESRKYPGSEDPEFIHLTSNFSSVRLRTMMVTSKYWYKGVYERKCVRLIWNTLANLGRSKERPARRILWIQARPCLLS